VKNEPSRIGAGGRPASAAVPPSLGLMIVAALAAAALA
jgi:hypothetical protein